MAKASQRPRRRRGTIIGVTAVVAVLAVLTTLAITAQGYQAQVVPKVESSVWVARSSGQYARVNTDLGQIDTVRSVSDPTDVIQSGPAGVVYSEGDRQAWPVNGANPTDLTASTGKSAATGKTTPVGTRTIVSAGQYVVYLTSVGRVYLGTLAVQNGGPQTGDPTVTTAVDPFASNTGKNTRTYVATAVAVSASGDVASYSAAEHGIRRYDATTNKFSGSLETVTSPPPASAKVQLSVIGGKWVLSDPSNREVWIEGHAGPIKTHLTSATVLESSATAGTRVYVADASSLVSVDLTSGAVSSVAQGSGVAAAPTAVGSTVYAAWLSETGGALWSSKTGKTISLKTEPSKLKSAQAIAPIIRSNGQRAVLSEQTSGLLWTVPNGKLIPLSEWSLGTTTHNVGTVKVNDVAQEEPPVAVADSFGVRHGEQVQLPLLLNDHDPNKKDVLTITPGSINGGLSDKAFGVLGLVDNDQEAVINVKASSGSATFSYTVTDGTLTSPPATVTVTVAPSARNSPPVWCGVTACVEKWPSPQIAPGGTITVPVLTGWVDPDGDAFVLSDAKKVNSGDPVTVVPTSDGSVAIRHLDPNAASTVVPIDVTITDAHGASATKTLNVTVTGSPALVASPIALVSGVNQSTTVSIGEHVSGGSGSFRLLDATTTTTGSTALTVSPNTAAGQIVLSASKAGSYAVTYTVEDTQTQTQQSSLIRLTAIGGGQPLTIPPLTAFVRANQDTTIDVADAVQNTSGRVLIVSSAVSSGPALSASVVGQSSVRVSGSTPSGQPGEVGSAVVTVSDGAGASVTGVLTVFLVPASTGVGPIAKPDAVTVRAGAEVDIPVTTNDVTPRGELPVVSPKIKGSGAKGELAFVSGDVVRYLAPQKAGTYVLHYSEYLQSDPARLDTTTITVVVLPSGSNRKPDPPILTARVLAGQAVTIPVESYGMDPDGDPVVLTGVAQPKAGSGVAEIGADGNSITYTAPADGVPGGQLSFGYTVRDSQGASASGTVRVGVLNSTVADFSPVTYSDYVRVEKNSSAPITVLPLLNDSDPAQGKLKLVSVVPNAPDAANNPEYARLKSLISGTTSLTNGKVVLKAGAIAGTQSYIYTVESSASSSTAQGLIVVTVSNSATPDEPQVTDTVITAKDRSQLATGIDVVTNKVQWPTGDISDLKLAIWGPDAAGYTVKGWDISGKAPTGGGLVPFSLTGSDASGAKVVTYGFLRIPAFDDLRIQLNPSARPVTVAEEKTVSFDIRDEVDIAGGDTIQVRHDSSYAAQRSAASCKPSGASSAVYSSGLGSPWTDSCTVPVRLLGQTTWTLLAVPILIEPKNPQAELSSISRIVAPGATETVDMYGDMTTWEGGKVGDKSLLNYATTYVGSAFVVTHTGDTVKIVARADASPGTRETIRIAVTSYGGLSSDINLVVGVAPPDAPIGATFTHQCEVTAGSSCRITAVGIAGEYDPFQGKVGGGLHLVSVSSSLNCSVATVETAGDKALVATWPSGPKPVGGECTVPYTVKDAQGRTGGGILTLDVQGYPQTPASITTTGYGPTFVTLTVDLGEAAQAHPPVTGVTLYENGSKATNASCQSNGDTTWRCDVTGLVNGVQHRYTARAVNGQGESLDTTAVTTWAYATPTISNISSTPVYVSGETTKSNAVVSLSIDSGTDVRSFTITPNGESLNRTGTTTTHNIDLAPGTGQIAITPVSQFQPPIAGDSNSGATTHFTINEAPGAPFFSPNNPSGSAASNTSITVTNATLNANSSSKPQTVVYIAWLQNGGSEPSCTTTFDGQLSVGFGGVQSTSSTITGLTAYEEYYVKVCGSNGYGSAESARSDAVFTGVNAPDPTGSYSYTVSTTAGGSGSHRSYGLAAGPNVGAPGLFTTYYLISGVKTTNFSLNSASAPTSVQVEFCSIYHSNFCSSNPATVSAATAPTTVDVTFNQTCMPLFPSDSDVTISAAAQPYASISEDTSAGTYKVTWSGPYASLNPATSDVLQSCL